MEASSWDILDGEGVFAGAQPSSTLRPSSSWGAAVVALVNGALPTPPPYKWWFFGAPTGANTIEMTCESDTLPEHRPSGASDD